jgi:hypothetical protein
MCLFGIVLNILNTVAGALLILEEVTLYPKNTTPSQIWDSIVKFDTFDTEDVNTIIW